MKNLCTVIAVMVAMGIAIWGCGKKEEPAASDMAALQGTWIGHVVGEQQAECKLILKADTFEFSGPDAEETRYKGTYVLYEQAEPKAADFHIQECGIPEYAGKVAKGIYTIDGDTFTFSSDEPGSEIRPAEFGTDFPTFVLTKQK